MSERKKLDVLDGLRGFAVLLVVLFHYRQARRAGHLAVPFFHALAPFRFGYSGVNLFLVLSGFCLTLSLIRRTEAGETPTLRTFLANRWRRIAPPFYIAMAVYLAAGPLLAVAGVFPPGRGEVSAWQVFVHTLFLHGLWPDSICAINDPFWSLSLEFQFYVTLPLLFVGMLRFGAFRTLAVVTVASWLWRVAILSQPIDRFYAINGFLLGRWPEFAIGMVIAFRHTRPGRSSTRTASTWTMAVAAAALLLLASGLALKGQVLWSDYVYGLGYGALLITVLPSTERRTMIASVFSARPLVWLGSISYSVYLTHSLLLDVTLHAYRVLVSHPTFATEALGFAGVLGAVLAGGWGFFQLVERRSFHRPSTRSAAADRRGPALVNQAQPA